MDLGESRRPCKSCHFLSLSLNYSVVLRNYRFMLYCLILWLGYICMQAPRPQYIREHLGKCTCRAAVAPNVAWGCFISVTPPAFRCQLWGLEQLSYHITGTVIERPHWSYRCRTSLTANLQAVSPKDHCPLQRMPSNRNKMTAVEHVQAKLPSIRGTINTKPMPFLEGSLHHAGRMYVCKPLMSMNMVITREAHTSRTEDSSYKV
jgi:hypothetical protein